MKKVYILRGHFSVLNINIDRLIVNFQRRRGSKK